MTLTSATRPLIDASVTGFKSVMAALLIYLGSTLWFLLLVAIDSRELIMETLTESVRDLYVMTIVGNCTMFVLQTINVWCTLFRFWPVVSLYYTAQLWVIGLRASLVAIDDDDDVVMNSLVLLAQCLFTSSQLSVTLEYLYRKSYESSPPTSVTVTTQPIPQRRVNTIARRF